MKVNGIPTRTIWPIEHGQAVGIIDQTRLPFEFVKEECVDWRQRQNAIATMKVRGAPLIGISGAWAMVLAMKEDPRDEAVHAVRAGAEGPAQAGGPEREVLEERVGDRRLVARLLHMLELSQELLVLDVLNPRVEKLVYVYHGSVPSFREP